MEKQFKLKDVLNKDKKIFEHNKHVAKYEPMLNKLSASLSDKSDNEKRSALIVYDCLLRNIFQQSRPINGFVYDEWINEKKMDPQILSSVMKFYSQFTKIENSVFDNIEKKFIFNSKDKWFLRRQLKIRSINDKAVSNCINLSRPYYSSLGDELDNMCRELKKAEASQIIDDIKKIIIRGSSFDQNKWSIKLRDVLSKMCSGDLHKDNRVPDFSKDTIDDNDLDDFREYFWEKFCCESLVKALYNEDVAENIYYSMFVPRSLTKPDKNDKKPNKTNMPKKDVNGAENKKELSQLNEKEMSKPLQLSQEILNSYDRDAIDDVIKNGSRQYPKLYSLSEIIKADDFSEMTVEAVETIIRHNLDFDSVCETSYAFGKTEVHRDVVALLKDIENISANLVNKNPEMILKFYYKLVPDIMALREKFDFKKWAKDLSIPVYENVSYDNQDLDYINKQRDFEYLHTVPYIPKFDLVYKFLLSRMDNNGKLIDQETLDLIPKECTDILQKAGILGYIKKIFEALDNSSQSKTSIANNMDDLADDLNAVIKFMYENKIITGEKPAELRGNDFDPNIIDKTCEFFRVLIFHFSKLFDHEYSIANSIKLAKFESYLKTQFNGSKISPFEFLNVANQIVPKQGPEKDNIIK